MASRRAQVPRGTSRRREPVAGEPSPKKSRRLAPEAPRPRSGRAPARASGRAGSAGAPPSPRERGRRATEGARAAVAPEPAPAPPPSPFADVLPRPGKPPRLDPVARDVRRIVGELREACGGCPYRRLCAYAPVKLQIERRADAGARHRHEQVLKEGLSRLARLDGDWQRGLVGMLASREKDALLAGCLLHQAWRKTPDSMRELIAYAVSRCGVEELKERAAATSSKDEQGLLPGQGIDPDALQCRMFRGQVLRAAAFFADEDTLVHMQSMLVLDADDESRLFQYEAVAVLGLLIGRRLPGTKWIKSLEKDVSGPFRATFAARDPGNGGLDVFFPYRRGKRRSYLYLRRDQGGNESITSIDKIRVDSLLHRIFVVFHTDELKTHRILKELCRHLNVHAGKYNANHLLEGFQRLARDDLLLLGIYAPALARAVGHFVGAPDFHLLVKFLYKLRGESGRRGDPKVAAHEKVLRSREEWERLVAELGADLVKSVFSVLFRLNASYKRRVYTTPTYLKIGEVAYLLTALSGWNPKGLEIELKQGKKPLAFVAYGMQPPSKWSRVRVGKLERAAERVEGHDALERALEVGRRNMVLLHDVADWDALVRAARDERWEPAPRPLSLPPPPANGSSEEFSEFEDMDDSGIGSLDPNLGEDDVVVVVEDHETDEQGRLKSKRLTARSGGDDDSRDDDSRDDDSRDDDSRDDDSRDDDSRDDDSRGDDSRDDEASAASRGRRAPERAAPPRPAPEAERRRRFSLSDFEVIDDADVPSSPDLRARVGHGPRPHDPEAPLGLEEGGRRAGGKGPGPPARARPERRRPSGEGAASPARAEGGRAGRATRRPEARAAAEGATGRLVGKPNRQLDDDEDGGDEPPRRRPAARHFDPDEDD